MLVKELIEALQKMPPDAEVVTDGGGRLVEWTGTVSAVELRYEKEVVLEFRT